MKKLWGGRFKQQTEGVVEDFTESVSFDARLGKHDIEGSIAHVKMLAKQKIIKSKEASMIIKGLGEIGEEIEAGRFRFKKKLEDVHMNIEYALIRKIGPVGGKLHSARSRNDQVALDLRLYLREETGGIIKMIKGLQKLLVRAAEKNIDIIMPGYTHLQRAQPVLLSHHLLAYYEMLERDAARFADCLKRLNVLPLGSAALAGTTLPIDRSYTAKLLGFKAVSDNSIDSVSDRDFVIEFISASSINMIHLSRFSEEVILWNSEEFGFVELPDSYTTGSSIMPQKKNPDVLELTRGKTGRVFGDLMAVLTMMKGLPLAYNRDMQEDKEPVFDTVDTLKACLNVLTGMVPGIRFRKKKIEESTRAGFLTATDIAEYLVNKNMPFREAHGIAGAIVRYCIDKKMTLGELTVAELKGFSGYFKDDISDFISLSASVERRNSYGGTSRKRVLSRIKEIKGLRKK